MAPKTPTDTVQASSSVGVHQRLDALDARLSWFYVRLLLLTGLSRAVHAAELVLFAFTRRLVAHNVGMGTSALEALGVGVFLGSAVGGPLFGLLADARGRRSALLLAMTLSLAGLALSAIAKKDYHVIAARIVAGVGLGGELPASTVLVQELAPRPMRGRMVVLLEAFTGLGGVIGVAWAYGLAPQLGWRVTYMVICGCVAYVGVLRFGITESPLWLASVGRVDEALLVVEKLELAHGKQPSYDNVKMQDAPTPVTLEPLASVGIMKQSACSKPTRTAVMWALWTVMAMSSYALGVYVPTLISMSGFNMYEGWSTVALLHACQAVGCVVVASILESHGLKQSLACFATSASVASVLLSYLPWNRPVVITGTCLASALLAGTWSCVLAYTPESYPTAVRARGVSYAFGFSRLGAAGGTLLYPHMFDVWLLSVRAITWIFAVLLAAIVLGIVVPYGFNPTCRGVKTDDYERSALGSNDSDTDLEAGAEEDHLLVVNAGGRSTAIKLPKLKRLSNFIQEPEREDSRRAKTH